MRDEFSRFHPLNNFIYFAAVIIFSTIYMEPVLLLISLFCAILYSLYLDGRKSLKLSMLTVLPIALFAALVNIAFNHNGMTVLNYLPTGNPLTLESIIFGLCAACLFANVILWFFCFNRVITSDKFIYLFGKIIPSLSLVLSMIMRFIPLFKKQHHSVVTAQKTLYESQENKGLKAKLKHSFNIFSIMLTWSLENSIITADSMNSRGYGLKGRTAFSYYRFYFRDGVMLAVQLLLIIIQVVLTIFGCSKIAFYPYYEYDISLIKICGYAVYIIFCLLPIIINLTEDMKWNYFRSKI
ncbi:MAG: energy-coupling factor transporter transmembrane protein EcfT [Clostridiales bacterium]|nr:energy-coupling factor transporter transmembrane protein EcfT [Clostridiales bacterium]